MAINTSMLACPFFNLLFKSIAVSEHIHFIIYCIYVYIDIYVIYRDGVRETEGERDDMSTAQAMHFGGIMRHLVQTLDAHKIP
jgi:hypothetical protein